MGYWTKDLPPTWRKQIGKKDPIATEQGWVDPDTGEVIVAMNNLPTEAGPADVVSVRFGSTSYAQGDPLSVIVVFNEVVNVVAGATLEVSSTGVSGNFNLHAAAQSGSEIVFDKQSDNLTQEVVPSETAELGLAGQSIVGTITDSVGGGASNLVISGQQATEAGTRNVA